jgi:hypothetical protein
MRSILRKCAVSVVVVGGALLVQPGNFANAAQTPDTPRAAVRKCVNTNQQARTKAQNQFKADIRAARALPAAQQQAAVQAAQTKFQNAAEAARSAFNNCIAAANPN